MAIPLEQLKPDNLALIGLCSDDHSSFMPGAAAGPAAIRMALQSGAANLTSETGIDLGGHPGFVDLGDRQIAPGAESLMGIQGLINGILTRGARPLVLAAVAYPGG